MPCVEHECQVTALTYGFSMHYIHLNLLFVLSVCAIYSVGVGIAVRTCCVGGYSYIAQPSASPLGNRGILPTRGVLPHPRAALRSETLSATYAASMKTSA